MRAALHEAMLGAIIDQRVSVSESPEDKRDRWLQRALCASAIRLAAEAEMTNVALKPSCRGSGATRGQSKYRECQPKSKSTKKVSGEK